MGRGWLSSVLIILCICPLFLHRPSSPCERCRGLPSSLLFMPFLLPSRSGEILYPLSREVMGWTSSKRATGHLLPSSREAKAWPSFYFTVPSFLFSPYRASLSPHSREAGAPILCILLEMRRAAPPSFIPGRRGVLTFFLESREAGGCHHHPFVSLRLSPLLPQRPYLLIPRETTGGHYLPSSRQAEGGHPSP